MAKENSGRLGNRGCLMAKQPLFTHQTAPVCPPNRGCQQTNGVFIADPCIICSDRLCGGTPADEGLSSITTAAPSYTPKLLTVSAVRQSDGENQKKNNCSGLTQTETDLVLQCLPRNYTCSDFSFCVKIIITVRTVGQVLRADGRGMTDGYDWRVC